MAGIPLLTAPATIDNSNAVATTAFVKAQGYGTGTVTSASVATANGFGGTVATASTTPALTLSTTVTGIAKGNGTALSAAVAGTDYLAPAGSGAALTGTPWGGVSVRALSAATTLTSADLTKTVACTVSSAWTLTLPAASGCTGGVLTVLVVATSTRLLTLAGQGTDTIDGATSRILWAGESAVLYSDGTSWHKIGGTTLPMICNMYFNTTESVASNTYTKVPLNGVTVDSSGAMADATNTRIDVARTGTYAAFGLAMYSVIPAGSNVYCVIYKNGAFLYDVVYYAGVANWATAPLGGNFFPLAAGDYVELYALQASATTATAYGDGSAGGCFLALLELPQW